MEVSGLCQCEKYISLNDKGVETEVRKLRPKLYKLEQLENLTSTQQFREMFDIKEKA